jgi:hypothetical protein
MGYFILILFAFFVGVWVGETATKKHYGIYPFGPFSEKDSN